MSALLVLAAVLAVAGLGAAGVRTLIEWAESRRAARWSHTLGRFCGDSACGVCRSRELSAGSARLA